MNRSEINEAALSVCYLRASSSQPQDHRKRDQCDFGEHELYDGVGIKANPVAVLLKRLASAAVQNIGTDGDYAVKAKISWPGTLRTPCAAKIQVRRRVLNTMASISKKAPLPGEHVQRPPAGRPYRPRNAEAIRS